MRSAVKKPAKKPQAKAGTSKKAASTRKLLFVEAYIANGGNATDAAKKAGFSPKTAYSQGGRLLKDAETAALLAERRGKLAAAFELTTEAVLKNLAQAIYFDPRKLYRDDGNLKDIWELDDDSAMALAGFEVTEEKQTVDGKREVVGFTKKVKWLDKNTARDQAMKHLGQYREDNTQRNPLADVPRDALKELVDRLRA